MLPLLIKLKFRMAILRPILKASTLNFESKLAILRTLVFSIFLYAAQAIQPSSKLQKFKPYDKFQIRCLRFILNWPRQIPNDLIELVAPITSITEHDYKNCIEIPTRINWESSSSELLLPLTCL